ncbi:COG4223 family protein [Shimia sp. Alg240-R146]|uniref:COG4223 family protein n=1 Tax=Shimia sp. Alg240-R146 TaxID=2993449 RepID=UPI0022E28A2F|nr:mitofilin family membrane protein [Shimia sp. Alg240-R146]
MGNSDKTNKPEDDQVKADDANVDEIEDAEIVDETENETVVAHDEASVVLNDPEAEESDEAADEDAEAETFGEADVADEDVAEDYDAYADEAVSDEGGFVEPMPVAAPEKRGGFLPMVLGGVVAAAIGFGGAVYFGDQLGIGAKTDDAIAKVTADLVAQKDALAAVQDKLGAATNDAAGAAKGVSDAVAQIAGLHADVDGLAAELQTLSDAVAGFETRLNDIEKRPLNEGLGAAAIAAYEREVNDLKDLVAAQKADAAELKDKADLSAKAALARSAATRIVVALDSGAAFSGALVDYRSATGAEVGAALADHAETGVVTLAALLESYPDAARAALAKARADKVDDAQGSKLGNFLKNQLGARSVEVREGGDTDAILSRVEAALRDGKLAEALAELDSLAEAPKAMMEGWRAEAQTRLAAKTAADALAQALNSN